MKLASMNASLVNQKANRIVLTPKETTDRQFLLIHGYTGSPTDFNDLPKKLHRHFNAHVSVPLLRGHGTHVEDLNPLEYEHFYAQVKRELELTGTPNLAHFPLHNYQHN